MSKEIKITGVFFCIIISFVIAVIFYPWLDVDSGYYLKIAYDLSNGYSFFKDIGCGYTPMGMYIYSLPIMLYPQISASLLFLYLLLIYAISIFLFYKIIKGFGVDKPMRILYSFLLLVALFTNQGTYFLLEPIVLLFQLGAILLVLKGIKHNKTLFFLFSGVAIFFAFYSKQYGLFIVPGILVLLSIYTNSLKNLIYRFVVVGIGFFLPFFIIVSFQHLVNDLSIIDILKRFSGIDYVVGDQEITGVHYSFKKFMKSISLFLVQFPFVFSLFFLKTSRSDWKNKQVIAFLLLAVFSFSQLYFAGYRHYYQLIVPYILLLFLLLVSKKQNQGYLFVRKIAVYLAIFFILPASIHLIRECNKRIKRYNAQEEEQQILESLGITHSKVYLQGISPAYYFLCKFDSPDLKYLGYKFPEELSFKDIDKYLPIDCHIIGDDDLLKSGLFTRNYDEVKTFFNEKGERVIVLRKRGE